MAVSEFTLEFTADKPRILPDEWAHAGVVSSGDLEVLIEKNANASTATFNIRTKASGFEHVWKNVLERFVQRTGLAGVKVDINDNAATPPVVSRRIEQALQNGGGLR